VYRVRVILDHVALLTADLAACAQRVAPLGLEPGPVEEFPGEGTREQYWGIDGTASRLLVIQPFGEEGPYARALRKRGPGLHHVALHVSDLDAFLGQVSGWLVLPASLLTRDASHTLWLARPGVGTLLEVCASDSPAGSVAAVEAVEVPVEAGLARVLREGCGGPVLGLEPSSDAQAWLRCGQRRWSVADLVG
jgi:methylmalonyl-CoA/ethylmalonyl-CoA epimerase